LIPAHREIADRIRTLFPEESEEDLADTIEGASDLPDAIFRVLRTAIEREANGKALAEIIDTMVSRRRRLDEGARTLRTEALRAMEVAGLKKLAAPDMSISVGVTRPKVLIIDDTAVPDDLCKITRAPSRAEIAKALAEGRDVPGVMLGNPETHLTIHRR
jgi:hypothetical protein